MGHIWHLGRLPWIVISCSVAFATWTPLLIVLARTGLWERRSRAFTGLGAVVLCATLVLFGPSALGLLLALFGVVQYGPQVWIALTTDALEGVSLLSQGLYCLCAVSNLGIGLIAQNGPLTAWSVTFIVASSVVILQKVQVARGDRALHAPATTLRDAT